MTNQRSIVWLASVAISCGSLAAAATTSAPATLQKLTTQLSSMPAPENPIPVGPVSQTERPLPSGYIMVAQELKWRALYSSEPGKRREAQRTAGPSANPTQLLDLVATIDTLTDEGEFPAIGDLQDPRAVPALRSALTRLRSSQKKWFVLQALYACGDWNHSATLLEMAKEPSHGSDALQLLALYHPDKGIQACLEALGFADQPRYGIKARESTAQIQAAVHSLERLRYKELNSVLLAYFRQWPTPFIARKLGDYRVADAAPLLEVQLREASKAGEFGSFRAQTAYHYAMGRLSKTESIDWFVQQRKLILSAPSLDDYTKLREWEMEKNITQEDVGLFCQMLVKLSTPETLSMYVDYLCRELATEVQRPAVTDALLENGDSPLLAEALVEYFSRMGDYEKGKGLTSRKKALALHFADSRASRLLEEYVPDATLREDLVSLATEFGHRGLMPNAFLIGSVDSGL